MKSLNYFRPIAGLLAIVVAIFFATYDMVFNDAALISEALETVELSEDDATLLLAGKTCDPELGEKLDSEEPLHIKSGDTLSSVLRCANIPAKQVNAAIQALKKEFNPRSLAPKHEMYIQTSVFEEDDSKRNLLSLVIRPNFESEVLVEQNETGGYTALKRERSIKTQTKIAKGEIDSSLYISVANQGVPSKIIQQMIREYSYEVDFQRSLKKGDSFEIMYTVNEDVESGKTIPGNFVFGKLNLSGDESRIYRFKHKDGQVGYYNPQGRSIRKSILSTPVDGARISSGFGKRKHPIRGYTIMHKGIDFAVNTGTPVMAAGDGVVEKASWFGSYGKYLRIRHPNGYKTAYAHLSRFGKNIRVGKRVKQGQIVAYSGNTGGSTGPHLHFELIQNNKQINPNRIKKLPGGVKLKGHTLQTFIANKENTEKMYMALNDNGTVGAGTTQLAQAGS